MYIKGPYFLGNFLREQTLFSQDKQSFTPNGLSFLSLLHSSVKKRKISASSLLGELEEMDEMERARENITLGKGAT